MNRGQRTGHRWNPMQHVAIKHDGALRSARDHEFTRDAFQVIHSLLKVVRLRDALGFVFVRE